MRGNTLVKRLKVALNFVIYGKGRVRIMTCGKCGKIAIAPISQKPSVTDYIQDSQHIDLVWSEFVQCLHCGAVCEEIQMWNFDGDPVAINPNITVNNKQEENQNETTD